MKIQIYRLLKLHLIKLNVYKKIKEINDDYSFNIFINQIELYLKKIFKIIYEYHVNGKRIYFIGFPKQKKKKFARILKKTKHRIVLKSMWITGFLTNRKTAMLCLKVRFLQNVLLNKEKYPNLQKFTLLNRLPDLVVVFRPNVPAIKECMKLKIPVIIFDNKIFSEFQSSYAVLGNFNLIIKSIKNFFFTILYAIFKKPKRILKTRGVFKTKMIEHRLLVRKRFQQHILRKAKDNTPSAKKRKIKIRLQKKQKKSFLKKQKKVRNI